MLKRFIVAVALLACAVPPAYAQQPTAAEEAYGRGVEHFKAERYRDAVVEFNKAYRRDPSPVLQFNIARCFEELGEYESAIRFYRLYLENDTIDDRKQVEQSVVALEALLAAQQAETPEEEPEEAARAEESQPEEEAADDALTEEAPPPADDTDWKLWAGWGCVGLGVAGLAVGGVYFGQASGTISDIEDLPAGRKSEYDALESDAQSQYSTALVATGLGVALVGTGVAILLWPEDDGVAGLSADHPGALVWRW